MAADKHLTPAIKRHIDAQKAYQAKFGENSLDRVIYCEPLDTSVAAIIAAASVLEQAVTSGNQIAPIPVEMWDKIVF